MSDQELYNPDPDDLASESLEVEQARMPDSSELEELQWKVTI